MKLLIDIEDDIINEIKKNYPKYSYENKLFYILNQLNEAFDPKFDNGAKIINKVAASIMSMCEGIDLNEYKVAEMSEGSSLHFSYNHETYRNINEAIKCLNEAKSEHPDRNYVILQRIASYWEKYQS